MNHISTDIYKNNLDHLLNYLYLYKPKTDNPQLPKIENAAAFL